MRPDNPDDNILIISAVTIERDPTPGTKRGFDDRVPRSPQEAISKRGSIVAAGTFKANFDAIVSSIADVVSDALGREFGHLALSSLDVELGVEADGKVGILGTGVGVKGSSSIKLTFTRRQETG